MIVAALAILVLVLSFACIVIATSNEPPGRLLAILLVIAIYMATPWAFSVVWKLLVG